MSFRKLSFDYKMAPVQCVTPMTNVGRTVNLWSFFCCAKKNFTWWFSIHTHSHTQSVQHAHIERKIPHLPTTTKPTGGMNHFFLLFFLLSKVNKRSLRDNIVRAISIWTWTWTRAWRQRNKEVAIVRKRRKRKIKWKEKKIINACIKCRRYLSVAIKQCVWQLNRIGWSRKKNTRNAITSSDKKKTAWMCTSHRIH